MPATLEPLVYLAAALAAVVILVKITPAGVSAEVLIACTAVLTAALVATSWLIRH